MYTIFGIRLIADSNIKFEPKYPTGYKDGNRLGKRKRKLRIVKSYMVDQRTLLCHPDILNQVAKQITSNDKTTLVENLPEHW